MFRKNERLKRSSKQVHVEPIVEKTLVNSSPKFFESKNGCPNQQQNVTVNITVNEKEEGEITSCLRACFSCAKTAASK
jgi:hypothetical protein